MQAVEALGPVACVPAQHRRFGLTNDGRDLGHREPLFGREGNHLGARPQPRILGGAIPMLEGVAW
jgi:hypothetical protein